MVRLGLHLLFLCRREEYVVEYETVAGTIGMKVEVGGRVAYIMLIISGIVSAVPSPCAFAVFAVDVSRLVCRLVFAHEEYARFQDFLAV